MMNKFLYLIIIISLLSACSDNSANSHKKRGSRAALVVALPVQNRAISTQEHASGSLIANQFVKIFNQEPGQINKLPYYQGDSVKRGDILVSIRNDKVTALLSKSQATRSQAQSNVSRLSQLSSKNLTSHDELSQAKTALSLAEAEEAINKIRLADTYIKAPFSGVISERRFETGDIVPLHSHILSIIDISTLFVKIQVSELLLTRLILGNNVTIQIDALPQQQKITGTISRIYPTVDPNTRKGTIEIKLDVIPSGAKPGQLVRVSLYSPVTKRLLIDVNAIQYDNTGKYVYRINSESRLDKVSVQTGIQIKDQIEIVAGLNNLDNIVTEGFSNLKKGKKVKITNPITSTIIESISVKESK